jgi:hypothetical protein
VAWAALAVAGSASRRRGNSHIDLAETDGRREPGFDAMLREALEPVRAEYDFIVIDAPPNLGMLNWMALAAAEDVIPRIHRGGWCRKRERELVGSEAATLPWDAAVMAVSVNRSTVFLRPIDRLG